MTSEAPPVSISAIYRNWLEGQIEGRRISIERLRDAQSSARDKLAGVTQQLNACQRELDDLKAELGNPGRYCAPEEGKS